MRMPKMHQLQHELMILSKTSRYVSQWGQRTDRHYKLVSVIERMQKRNAKGES